MQNCINRQYTWFASIFLVYVLSDHSIILRKYTPGWRGCKIACKGGLFFLPHLSSLPHLPGVPHLHVNRPQEPFRKGRIIRNVMEWGAGMEFFSRLVDISLVINFIVCAFPRCAKTCVRLSETGRNLVRTCKPLT